MKNNKKIHITILVFVTTLIVLAGLFVPRMLLAIKAASITGRTGSFDSKSLQPYSAHVIQRENKIRDELKYYNEVVDMMNTSDYNRIAYTYANKGNYYTEIANNGYYEPMYQLSRNVFARVIGYESPVSLPIRSVTINGNEFVTATSDDVLRVVMDTDTGLPLYAKLEYNTHREYWDYDDFYIDDSRVTSAWSKMIDTYSSILGVRFLGDIDSYYDTYEFQDTPVYEAQMQYGTEVVNQIIDGEHPGYSYYTTDEYGSAYICDINEEAHYRCAITTDNTIRVNMVINRQTNWVNGDVVWNVELWVDLV